MVKYKNEQLSPLKRELVADFYRKLDEKYKLPCVNWKLSFQEIARR